MRADLLLEHFDTLVKTPEDVAGLEAAILDLAVRGQLVPQITAQNDILLAEPPSGTRAKSLEVLKGTQ